MNDLTLDLPGIIVPDTTPEQTIEERWEAFHEANPHVGRALIQLFEDARAHGVERWSVKAAFEILRWQGMRTTGDRYALNNDFTALAGRWLAAERPDLAPMLSLRERRAA